MNFVHKFKVFLSFSQKFSRSSIAFYPPLRNGSMQSALSTAFIIFFIYGRVIIPGDSFQNSLKTCINCTKLRIQCPKLVCGGGGGGVAEKGGDVRMGGIVPWLLGG